MPRLSIIVPCYKVETYLPACIESIQTQTLRDWELILVDDGSPDRSGAIADEYAAKDPRISVIHKANGGVSAARNDGLARATGEFVIFVDSDDYVPPTAYEHMIARADQEHADLVIGDVYRVEDGQELLVHFYREAFTTDDPAFIQGLIRADFYKNYCPDPPPEGPAFGYGGPWNKIVRREMLSQNGIRFDLRVKGLYDDIIFTAHALANARRISYLPEPVYGYRILSNSITNTFKPAMPEIAEAILAAFTEFKDKHGRNGEYDLAFYALSVRLFAYCLPRYYCNRKNEKSFFARCAELRAAMQREPYAGAARKVEKRVLTRGQRCLAWLMRFRAAALIVLSYGIK